MIYSNLNSLPIGKHNPNFEQANFLWMTPLFVFLNIIFQDLTLSLSSLLNEPTSDEKPQGQTFKIRLKFFLRGDRFPFLDYRCPYIFINRILKV
jgi:hypothetical protein